MVEVRDFLVASWVWVSILNLTLCEESWHLFVDAQWFTVQNLERVYAVNCCKRDPIHSWYDVDIMS